MTGPTTKNGRVPTEVFEGSFLTGSAESLEAYQAAMTASGEVLAEHFATRLHPYSGAGPEELTELLNTGVICPEVGSDLKEVLSGLGESILENSVVVSHPACMAHLHCPPLLAALAAEALIAATNQSMDSWDQSPAATFLEERMVGWLCRLFGLGDAGDGVFTSGGTQSNFMGLLLARDRYARERLGWSIQEEGLPLEAHRFRIFCSEAAHFTVRQSATLLGLGSKAVIPVETDSEYRMKPEALDRQLEEASHEGLLPIALVGTAGTTDFGSIDPLPQLAERAAEHGLWLHVDAAYGGALILSDRHCEKLDGIREADSIAIDFHKQFYQPISCGAFLLKDSSDFGLIRLHADYLNPEEDDASGVPNLVTKSVQTTRRFDALKLFVSLRVLGRKNLAAMIDHTVDLASETARIIAEDPALELANQPEIGAVVFRYLPKSAPTGTGAEVWATKVNESIRAALLHRGEAVLARTRVGQLNYLKFTLLNPRTTRRHVEEILDHIKRLGDELEKEND